MKFTVNALLALITAVAALLASISYGIRRSGYEGGVSACICATIVITLFAAAIHSLRRRRYYITTGLVILCALLTTFELYTLSDYPLFSAAVHRANRDLWTIESQLYSSSRFRNVKARVFREKLGGYVMLEGTVPSESDYNCLCKICEAYEEYAIENLVRIEK